MGIKVNIHPLFYRCTNNQEIAEVNGSTVGECLDDLIKQLPGLEGWLLIEGKLLNYIDIYVNRESVYPEGLNKPVKDGDELLMIPMLGAGGWTGIQEEHCGHLVTKGVKEWDWSNPEIMRIIGGVQITSYDKLVELISFKVKKGYQKVEVHESPRFMLLARG